MVQPIRLLAHQIGGLQASNSPTLIPLPSWLTAPYLPLNLGSIVALVYGFLYVLLEPVAGTAFALICCFAAAAGNFVLENFDKGTVNTYAGTVFVICWIAQFIGHGKFEGRAPALLDNLVQAFFLAPLFVWFELLFAFGYRPELQARVNKEVQKEIAKFRAEKEKKKAQDGKTNGKTE